jgi:pilus assembly protein CpaB
MRTFMIIFSALLVAGGSGFYLLQATQPAPQPAEEVLAPAPVAVQVYVPAAPLAAGTILVPDHLARMSLDEEAVTEEMVVADDSGREVLLGSVARQALPQGVPIARSAVVQPGDRGFLAAVLPQGKRAISIPIGEVAGVSGLVMPGDRVDIILTYSIAAALIDAEREIRASETVLTNLRVLALDQRLQEATTTRANDPSARPIARTATLEVTPQQAEMLTLATRLGDLSLVLNSVEDGGEPVAEETVSSLQVIAAAVTGAPEAAPEAIRRALTIDAQVTSLLQRDEAVREDVRPATRRVSSVQIVRGIQSQAFTLSRDPTAAELGAEPVLPEAGEAEPAVTRPARPGTEADLSGQPLAIAAGD